LPYHGRNLTVLWAGNDLNRITFDPIQKFRRKRCELS
jgi:hypothetical protein